MQAWETWCWGGHGVLLHFQRATGAKWYVAGWESLERSPKRPLCGTWKLKLKLQWTLQNTGVGIRGSLERMCQRMLAFPVHTLRTIIQHCHWKISVFINSHCASYLCEPSYYALCFISLLYIPLISSQGSVSLFSHISMTYDIRHTYPDDTETMLSYFWVDFKL